MRRERPALFKGRHFAPEIIILCVRRYLRYALSLRNREEIMAERNVEVDHVTIGAGSNIMHPNSVGVAGLSCARRTDPGVSMKRIFGWLVNGPIYIGRWIPLATRLISCSLQRVMRVLPSGSFKQHYS